MFICCQECDWTPISDEIQKITQGTSILTWFVLQDFTLNLQDFSFSVFYIITYMDGLLQNNPIIQSNVANYKGLFPFLFNWLQLCDRERESGNSFGCWLSIWYPWWLLIAAAMEFLFLIGFSEDVVADEIGKAETYLVLKRNDPGLLWLAKSSLETLITY